MALLWSGYRRPDRLLTEHDVVRAHIAAPHVLEAWQRHDARYWRLAALQCSVGVLVPAFGCLALGWSVGDTLLMLVLDVLALWVADALKPVLAFHRVQDEAAHRQEAATLQAVMDGLRRRRAPRSNGDLLAPRLPPGYYLREPMFAETDPRTRWYLLGITLLLLALGLSLAAIRSPQLLPWLALGLGLRLASTVAATRGALGDPSSRPELLAQAPLPTFAFAGATMAVVVLDKAWTGMTPQQGAWLVLLAYVLVVLGLSWLGWNNLHRYLAMLREFAARDRASLVERVRQVRARAES